MNLIPRQSDFYLGRLKYQYNEINLADRKRLDSYIPGKEIVSRKATELSEIKFETFENYLKELTTKYKNGKAINSSQLPPNTLLQGEYFLEIPSSNRNFSKIAEYENFAKNSYNVTIKYLDE